MLICDDARLSIHNTPSWVDTRATRKEADWGRVHVEDNTKRLWIISDGKLHRNMQHDNFALNQQPLDDFLSQLQRFRDCFRTRRSYSFFVIYFRKLEGCMQYVYVYVYCSAVLSYCTVSLKIYKSPIKLGFDREGLSSLSSELAERYTSHLSF